jgi:hypothetical protein
MYFKAVWCDGCEHVNLTEFGPSISTDCGRRPVIAIVPGQVGTFEQQSGQEDQDSTVKDKLGNELVATKYTINSQI